MNWLRRILGRHPPIKSAPPGKMYIFVYGTLRLEGRLNKYYMNDGKWIDTIRVELPYRMYTNSDYPYLVVSDIPSMITLEIWEVTPEQFGRMKRMEEGAGYTTVFTRAGVYSGYAWVFTKRPYGRIAYIASGDFIDTFSDVTKVESLPWTD